MRSRRPLALTPASRLISQQSVAGDCLIPFQNPSGIKTSSVRLDQGGQRYPCPEKKSAVLGCPPLMSAWVPNSLATHYGAGEHLPLYIGGLTCKYIDPAAWWRGKSTVQHRQRARHRARHKATQGTSSFFLFLLLPPRHLPDAPLPATFLSFCSPNLLVPPKCPRGGRFCFLPLLCLMQLSVVSWDSVSDAPSLLLTPLCKGDADFVSWSHLQRYWDILRTVP